MSYDLTVRANDRYSRAVARDAFAAIVLDLPCVQPNGSLGFALDDRPRRWMEIELEVVNEDGDSIGDDEGADKSQVNCVRFHIPYGYLRLESFEQDYLPVMLEVAKQVGWTLYDEQTEHTWSPS